MSIRDKRYYVIQYQSRTIPVFVPVDVSKNMATWYAPYSTPVRFKRIPQAQIALEAPSFVEPPFNEETLLPKWFQPWSEPKRFRPALVTANQQFLFWVQEAFGESPSYDKFNYPWSEPKRYLRDPRAQIALEGPFLAFTPQTAGETINPDKWFAPWSEPKRFKSALNVAQHPAEFYLNLSFFFLPPRNHGYIIM